MLTMANPPPMAIMMRIGSQPCIYHPRDVAARTPRDARSRGPHAPLGPRRSLTALVRVAACELFLNRPTSECYHIRFARIKPRNPSNGLNGSRRYTREMALMTTALGALVMTIVLLLCVLVMHSLATER